MADLIKRGLEDQDFSVELAFDGSSGKLLALRHDYDVIIMDIILPGINGIDLCKEVRLVKPDIPIIMLTALGSTKNKVQGLDAGADDYLVKPFDFRELEARIRSLAKRCGKLQPQYLSVLLPYCSNSSTPGTDWRILSRRCLQVSVCHF